ncbi:hypothetical protein C8J57DRAFT_1282999 [Mycena rebaudengoi]|nr:hypothetical protein C8J57DRAFT_1282999 [Mycena rebaudengoi]
MTPMTHYPSAGPNTRTLNATFDISETVLTTLTAAAQYTPLPFLQQASLLALAILNTVRAAKDNKESFKHLANDACELVSAIVCVYNDMVKDGQEPSPGLKKHVEDLIGLLQNINQFASKHASNGTMYRMVRRTSDYGKIQMYRGKLRQALDVFGLQSSISIHETVMQILKELRERETQEKTKKEETPPPPPEANPWGNLFGHVSGNVTMNNIAGNLEFHSTEHRTTIVDSFNGSNYSSSDRDGRWRDNDSY